VSALRRVDPLVLVWVLVAAVVWGLRGFANSMSRDASLYVYAGQVVADGHPPYAEVMNRAGPLAHLLPALGVLLGRSLGLEDVTGVRVVFFLVVLGIPALGYLLTKGITGSRLAGCASAVAALAFQGFAIAAANGPQSKQPMVLFLVVALVMLHQRRMLLAGAATALSVLTWQPVLFAAFPAALVVGLLGHDRLRDRLLALTRYAVGGLVALGVTVAGLSLAGGYSAFIEGFWTANARDTEQLSAFDRLEVVWAVMTDWYGWTTWLVVIGLLMALLLWLVPGQGPRADPMPAALAAAALGGTAWSLYAFNGAPDAMLVLPLAAWGVGGAVALLVQLAFSRAVHAVVAATVVIVVGLTAHLTLTQRTTDLDVQRRAAVALFDALPDDATVLAAEAPQPLALAQRTSISRFVLYGSGMTAYIDRTWPGGLTGYVDDLIAAEPTVVLGPRRGVDRFLRPLLREYVEVGAGPGWSVWLSEDAGDDTKAQVAAALATA
jgi:hypothetical protein